MKKLMMALVLMPVMALADTEIVNGIEWTFTISDGKAIMWADYPNKVVPRNTVGAIEIPSTLGGCPVTSIGESAFSGCSGLTSVTIPSSVTSIGGYAFGGCSGLMSVAIPEGVTSIGERAFYGCSGLTSITIPSSMTSIGNYAFRDCSGLTRVDTANLEKWCGISFGSYAANPLCCAHRLYLNGEEVKNLVIPAGVTSIGSYAFGGCSGLTSVTIPSSVTSIGDNAFADCTGLTSIKLDDGLTVIGGSMFSGCSGLESVTIPSSVTSIGSSAFSGCSGLTSVKLDDGLTVIGGGMFSGCSGLESVTIPSSVTSIGCGAFCGCSRLTSVTIPSSVTRVGCGAFCGCSSLLHVYFLGNAPEIYSPFIDNPPGTYPLYDDYDGTYGMNGAPITLVSYVREGSTGWSSGASADLPGSWQGRSIAHGEAPVVIDGVEWNFTTKNGKVSLGAGRITAVGGAVSGGVTIPAEINGMKVVEVNDNAFAGLGGITSVVIPASVRTIGSKAFYGCDGLDSVTFLGDAPYVYDDAFSGTKSTLAFSVPQGSIGWSDTSLKGLPGAWKGHAIQYAGGGQSPEQPSANLGTVTVSNIVVHYVLNSVQPQFAISPSQDMGFVNIITEVKSTGVAAIPMSWAMNYPNFVSKFGSDFTAALGKPTGKIGTGGTPMLVWQDYVAGTDPTNEKDVFTASITIVDGKVTISYTPELDDARKAMRKYTTWGKTSLMDTDWTEVQEGHEAEYNFFKVSVEMR